MHLEHVPKDEEHGNHAGRSLQRVAEIARVRILGKISLAPAHNQHPHETMKQKRQEDHRPLEHENRRWAEPMDLVGPMLVGAHSIEDRCIGCQVKRQISPDWNQTT